MRYQNLVVEIDNEPIGVVVVEDEIRQHECDSIVPPNPTTMFELELDGSTVAPAPTTTTSTP